MSLRPAPVRPYGYPGAGRRHIAEWSRDSLPGKQLGGRRFESGLRNQPHLGQSSLSGGLGPQPPSRAATFLLLWRPGSSLQGQAAAPHSFVIILGCRQVVRHGTLTPTFAGSSPAIPAKLRKELKAESRCPLTMTENSLVAICWSCTIGKENGSERPCWKSTILSSAAKLCAGESSRHRP